MLFKDFVFFKLWPPLCSAEQNYFSNFGKEGLKEQFCEIILKLANWPRGTSFKDFSILSSGGCFVQRSETTLPILVKGHKKISVKLYSN